MIALVLTFLHWIVAHIEDADQTSEEIFDPCKSWRNVEDELRKIVGRWGFHCENIENIIDNDHVHKKNFDSFWRSCGRTKPLLLFHGTLEDNLKSVKQKGLVVPSSKSGVQVRNGSNHGIGIYMTNADALHTSIGYCDTGKLIVCAVIPNDTLLLRRNDVYIALDSSLVLPCFVITLGYSGSRFIPSSVLNKNFDITLTSSISEKDKISSPLNSKSFYLVVLGITFTTLEVLWLKGYSVPAIDVLHFGLLTLRSFLWAFVGTILSLMSWFVTFLAPAFQHRLWHIAFKEYRAIHPFFKM